VNRIRLLLAAAYVFCVSTAAAAPITVAFDGFANGSESGSLYGVRNVGAAAGRFDFNVLSDPDDVYWDDRLLAFCIDVTTNLITSGSVQYDVVPAASYLNASKLSLISQLYDSRGSLLGTQNNGLARDAAFQLALWEIIYDFNGPLSLTSGSFLSSSFDGARELAQTWLGGLNTALAYTSSQYEFFVLDPNAPERNQTLLTARAIAVPEPNELSLLGAGMLVIGLLRRRRSKR
jgi:hypothetical protein